MCKNWKMDGAGKNSKDYERPADRRRRLGCEQDLRESFDRHFHTLKIHHMLAEYHGMIRACG